MIREVYLPHPRPLPKMHRAAFELIPMAASIGGEADPTNQLYSANTYSP